jgi:hypothetical protein
MCISGWVKRMPLRRDPPWDTKTQYFIVNASIFLLWLLRLISPAAWILSVWPAKKPEHPSALRTEIYVLAVNTLSLIVLFVVPTNWIRYQISSAFVILLIVENFQYHLYLMVFRPVIDKSYSTYGLNNFPRALMLTLISYQGLVTLFAFVYLSTFSACFNPPGDLTRISAWALSAGILTGTGFSGISPKVGSNASIVGGIESIMGMVFLATIVALVVGRAAAHRKSE